MQRGTQTYWPEDEDESGRPAWPFSPQDKTRAERRVKAEQRGRAEQRAEAGLRELRALWKLPSRRRPEGR